MQHWISNIHSMPLDLSRNTTYVVAENTTILTQSKNSFPSINSIQSVRISFTEKVITILHPMKIGYNLAISLSPNNVKRCFVGCDDETRYRQPQLIND